MLVQPCVLLRVELFLQKLRLCLMLLLQLGNLSNCWEREILDMDQKYDTISL